jgi:S1-C subfamily serine protease
MVTPPLLSLLRLPMTPGFLIEVVEDGSPAERAGLRGGHLSIAVQGEEFLVGGDILTVVGGRPIKNQDDFRAAAKSLRPGQRVPLTVFRDGATREVTLAVVERPRQLYDLAD